MSESSKPKGKRKVTIHRQKFVGYIYVTTVGLRELAVNTLKMSDVATFFKCDTRNIITHYKLYQEQIKDRGIDYDSKKKVFFVKELKFHNRKTNEFRTTN